jgi:hypothetical protein
MTQTPQQEIATLRGLLIGLLTCCKPLPSILKCARHLSKRIEHLERSLARVIPCSVCGRPAYRETDRERRPGRYTQLRCDCRSRRLRILDEATS